MKKYFIALTIFVLISAVADASTHVQKKEFSRVAQNMAERQASVYQLAMDDHGLLWLATDTDGILRYDGQQFTRWTSTILPSVDAPDFSKLLIDGDMIWAATWGHGLAAWNSATQQAFQFKKSDDARGLKNDRVQTLFKDSNDRLWIGSLDGLQYIETNQAVTQSLAFKFLKQQHPLNNLRIWWITESSLALWVATSQGVFRISPDLTSWKQYFIDPKNIGQNRTNEVRTVKQIGDTLWAGTDQGLFYFDAEADAFEPVAFSNDTAPPSLRVNDMVIGDSNALDPSLWVGASEGLYRVDTEEKAFIQQDGRWAELKNIDIRSLQFDQTGTLWLGTRGQGLYQGISTYTNFYDPLAAAEAKTNPESADNPIQAVHYSDNNDLWLASSAGIYKRTAATQNWQFFAFANEHAVREVNVLFTDSQDNLWVGTNEELFKTTTKQPKLEPFTRIKEQLGLDENTVTAIHELADGVILIGLWGQGIVRYDSASQVFSWQDRTFGELRGDQAYSIVTVEGSGVYSATRYSGLLNLSNQSVAEGPFNDTTLLCADSFAPNRVWLCSDSGLWMYDTQTGKTEQFTEADGLPSNRVLGLAEDTIGNLWVITSHGLARLNSDTNKIITLGEAEGLSTNSFLEHSIDSSAEDEITVGSMDGARSFSPSQIEIRKVVSNVALTAVALDNEDVTQQFALASKRLVLPEVYQTLTISFSVTDFRAPDKNAIRYQLAGVNEQWSSWSNNLSLNFSALSPGTYQLRVQGRNSQGIESAQPLTVSLVVAAPWWYSFWAFFIAALLFIVLIYLVIRLRTKTLERANRNLESEIALRTRELKVANGKLQKLSETDPLTGLLNRRGFERSFQRLLQQHKRDNKPLSVLLIDVDYFKKFNDDYGHDVGDQALKSVSQALSDGVREQDLVARWGGEEFTLALPGLTIGQAEQAAQRLRKAIANQSLEHGGTSLTITATIGVSSFDEHEDNLEVWIKAADEALYEGKKRGRNTVVTNC
ncbi:MAG: diguanylate cyclase [Pseudomonadota bacterium]